MEIALGNIFIRQLHVLNKGEKIVGHTHNFDHVTFINRGAVRLHRSDGQVIDVKADSDRPYLLTEAGMRHELTALEDGTRYFCIYSHRNAQGEVVQEYSGWVPAHAETQK